MNLTYEEIAMLVFLIEQAYDNEKDTKELVRLKTLLDKLQLIYFQMDRQLHGGRVM